MFTHEEQEERFGRPTGGGWLCLDFCNTSDWRILEDPVELLEDYEALVSWGNYAGILSREEVETLLERAQGRHDEIRSVMKKAIDLREALYRIFKDTASEEIPDADDLAIFNQALTEALPHLHIQQTDEGFGWMWTGTDDTLEYVLWPVVRSAADLLTSNELDRVGVCANEGCGWLFLDTSRNRSRRWCEMRSCGNRAKARRYYRRQKSTT